MRILLCIVSIVYAVLSVGAALMQIKAEKPQPSYCLMAAGSVVLVGAVACNIAGLNFDWAVALAGAVMICAAALWNGKRSGSLHWQHHAVRMALSAVLLIGFICL